jgi:siroheme synthase-like protein
MDYFPIFLDLRNKYVLVAGQYKILEFKIKKMIGAGAKIKFLSDLLPKYLEKYVESGKVLFIKDRFHEKYLNNVWLVVCGSQDEELKRRIAETSAAKNIFCNFVDEAPISSFISPSVISKGVITIAISTKGKSPALNKYLKNEIMNAIGDDYSRFAVILGKMRKKVIKHIPEQEKRRELFDTIVQNKRVQNMIRGNKTAEAEILVGKIIEQAINRRKQG